MGIGVHPAKIAIEGLLDTRYVINLGIGTPNKNSKKKTPCTTCILS